MVNTTIWVDLVLFRHRTVLWSAIESYHNQTTPLDVEQWLDAVVTIDNMLYKDAMKEFSITSMIGFGVDGSEVDKMEDFESVRGAFDSNPFVAAVQQHIKTKSALDAVLDCLSAVQ
ncbi:hypothetical protein MASR1M31_07130 [Porphyromonadaceae bacterium]